MTRNRISIGIEGARPHSSDAMTNSTTVATNRRTLPKRCDSQPVSGTEIALATANEVITQVPWLGETPRSPAIAGIDTFAIDVSSTFMNVASDTTRVPSARVPPVSGGCAASVGSAIAAAAGSEHRRVRRRVRLEVGGGDRARLAACHRDARSSAVRVDDLRDAALGEVVHR